MAVHLIFKLELVLTQLVNYFNFTSIVLKRKTLQILTEKLLSYMQQYIYIQWIPAHCVKVVKKQIYWQWKAVGFSNEQIKMPKGL